MIHRNISITLLKHQRFIPHYRYHSHVHARPHTRVPDVKIATRPLDLVGMPETAARDRTTPWTAFPPPGCKASRVRWGTLRAAQAPTRAPFRISLPRLTPTIVELLAPYRPIHEGTQRRRDGAAGGVGVGFYPVEWLRLARVMLVVRTASHCHCCRWGCYAFVDVLLKQRFWGSQHARDCRRRRRLRRKEKRACLPTYCSPPVAGTWDTCLVVICEGLPRCAMNHVKRSCVSKVRYAC